MKEKDKIKELFSDKLGNYEAKVSPELWAKVSAQIPSAAVTTAATGLSLLAKTLIGLGFTAAATTAIIIYSNQQEKEEPLKVKDAKVLVEADRDTNAETDLLKEKEEDSASSVQGTQETERTEPNHSSEYTEETIEEESEQTEHIIIVEEEKLTKEDRVIPEKSEKLEEEQEEILIEEEIIVVEDPVANEIIEDALVLDLPNVFTPNGDGENDFLFISDRNEVNDLSEFKVVVLNNSNKVVFTSTDPLFRWDGNGLDGMPVEDGTYVYFVTALDKNGNLVRGNQTLTIRR